ncbi:hypothetical protein [Dactylosporangium sp. CS-033363]|uniref:hypothetical protein n=1 Tax=Dactylosporangium sp. CS-033363 TaxID=3239935 RepID=UPI003D8A2D93
MPSPLGRVTNARHQRLFGWKSAGRMKIVRTVMAWWVRSEAQGCGSFDFVVKGGYGCFELRKLFGFSWNSIFPQVGLAACRDVSDHGEGYAACRWCGRAAEVGFADPAEQPG